MRSAVLAAVVTVAAVAWGCRKRADDGGAPAAASQPGATADSGHERGKPITWIIPEIKVQLITEEGAERPMDLQSLARRAGLGLRSGPAFAARAEAVGPGRRGLEASFVVRVSYGIIEDGSTGTPALFAAVEGQLEPMTDDQLELRDNVVSELPISASGGGAADIDRRIGALIDKTTDEMIDGTLAKEALRNASPETLAIALDGEPDTVLWALEVAAHRKLSPLASNVVELLTSADSEIADAAITAAVALGDRQAVEPLTKLAEFEDYERLRVIVEAVAALGGADAVEFLEFVATGHSDDDVREHAADALERLRR